MSHNEYKNAYRRIFERSGIDYKAIIGDGGAWAEKDSQEFMAVTPAHYRLETVGLFRQKICHHLMRSAEVQEEQSRIAQMDALVKPYHCLFK